MHRESPDGSSSIAMRSLAREGARLAALLLVSAVVVLQLVRDRGAGRSNTVEAEGDTLSLDLPSMENIRYNWQRDFTAPGKGPYLGLFFVESWKHLLYYLLSSSFTESIKTLC